MLCFIEPFSCARRCICRFLGFRELFGLLSCEMLKSMFVGIADVLQVMVGVPCLVRGVGEIVPHRSCSVEETQVLKHY
jgi:hypothetical protein